MEIPIHADAVPDSHKLYLHPIGRVTGSAATAALAAGDALATGRPGEAALAVEIIERRADGTAASRIVGAKALRAEIDPALQPLVARLAAPRAPWAGLSLDRPLVMGIVNVTPDSFSDGGTHADTAGAIAHGEALLAAGADLVDIGGESTRPGALPTPPEIETSRIVPVIRALAGIGAIVSVDTRNPAVMQAALDAGARIVNDVAALQAPGALDIVARAGASVILMHMQGVPETMQRAPHYAAAALDVQDFLETRIVACEERAIPRYRIMVDPGIGFGKRIDHNRDILARLGIYRTFGCGVALGVSRKGFIAEVAGPAPAASRLPGSLAAALAGVANGADLVRVHDVAETIQALRVAAAVDTAR